MPTPRTAYLLPESTVVIEGRVDLIHDTRVKDSPSVYLGTPAATVVTGVRADHSTGKRTLEVPERGNNTIKVELTDDRRLSSITFNTVGAGSQVLAAGVKLVAVVAGAAVRTAGPAGPALRKLWKEKAPEDTEPNTEPPTPEQARQAWCNDGNAAEAEHKNAYEALATGTTAKILAARQTLATTDDPLDASKLGRRIQQLEDLAADARAEVAKVDALYEMWSRARLDKYPQRQTFTLAVDELPVHSDPMSFELEWDVEKATDGSELKQIWEMFGVAVEIGPVGEEAAYRPNPTGTVGELDEQNVHWREPRPARLWVWRRDEDRKPVLEQVADVVVTDRYSVAGELQLRGRRWGEESVSIAFGPMGGPTKLEVGEKGVVGAIADAIAGAPEQFVAGLDAVNKASTTFGDLTSAADQRRLTAIKRQVEQRSQELELQGLTATADDFVTLKQLQQQVEIAEAEGTLAPPAAPTKLDRLEAQLKTQTVRRDLEVIRREHSQAAELGAMYSEIERLRAELQLIKLRERHETV